MRIQVTPSVYWTGQVIDYKSETAYNKTIPLLVDNFYVVELDSNVFRQYDRVKRLISQKRWVEVSQQTGGKIITDFRGVEVIGLINSAGQRINQNNFSSLLMLSPSEKNDIKQSIKRKIQKKVVDAFNEFLTNGLGAVDGIAVDGGSGGAVFIVEGDIAFDTMSYQDQLEYLKRTTDATFQINQDKDYLKISYGQERVFRVDARKIWGINTWKHKDESLTCAYDYLIGDKSQCVSEKWNKDKESVDKAVSLPKQEHKAIFKEWCHQHQEQFHKSSCDGFLPKIIPVNELSDDWMKFYDEDLSERYSDKEVESSLTVIDILKYCITARIRLNVLDEANDTYLNYNPDDFTQTYGKPKQNVFSIALRIRNRHAEFFLDSEFKKSLSHTATNHQFDKAPPIISKKKKKKGGDSEADKEGQEIEFLNATGDTILYKGNWIPEAPPLPDQLSMMTDHNRVYYTDKTSLNGIAQYLWSYHGMIPELCNGTLQTIKKLVYPKLTILNTDERPNWFDNSTERYTEELFELYPNLKPTQNKMPSETAIAREVWKKEAGDDANIHNSFMNHQVRKIFYENEIKPDNRNFNVQKVIETDTIVSYDVKKAYTTCLLTNTYDFQIYDSISQFKKYRGQFNPSYFYLCKNKTKDYPCRGEGLTLYHGCEVEVMMEFLEIKYYIPPTRTLKPDHYRCFVEKLIELGNETEVFKNIGYKSLVNRFIGDLKGREGISGYSQKITECRQTAGRMLTKEGKTIMGLGDRTWRKSLLLSSEPSYRIHHSTAQPIRLAVVAQLNRILYLLSKVVDECLYDYKLISSVMIGTKTDALYFKKIDDEFDAKVVSTWNAQSDYKIEKESEKDYYLWKNSLCIHKAQLGVAYVPNKWKNDIEINHKWSKKVGGNNLLDFALDNGGVWFSGMGGRGKSELIHQLKRRLKLNRMRLKVWKYIWSQTGENIYQKEREWLKKNPCSVKLFGPTNKSANAIGGTTLNKGLGIPVSRKDERNLDLDKKDEVEEEEVKVEEEEEECDQIFSSGIIDRMDANEKIGKQQLDLIVLEEISMIDGEKWDVISYIKYRYPNIRFILCGDIEHQLKPVGDEREMGNSYAIKEIAGFNRINLNYNFREGTATDDIWKHTEFSSGYAWKKGSLKSLPNRNLAFTNKTRKAIINIKQNELVNPYCFEVDEKELGPKSKQDGPTKFLKFKKETPLLARKSVRDLGISKNEMFIVMMYCREILWVYSENDRDKVIQIPMDLITKYFMSGFCITIHKSQGETYTDEYAIHDWNLLSVRSGKDAHRLRYVAVSRSVDYQNNVFVITDIPQEVIGERLAKRWMKLTDEQKAQKVESYKIDEEWAEWEKKENKRKLFRSKSWSIGQDGERRLVDMNEVWGGQAMIFYDGRIWDGVI